MFPFWSHASAVVWLSFTVGWLQREALDTIARRGEEVTGSSGFPIFSLSVSVAVVFVTAEAPSMPRSVFHQMVSPLALAAAPYVLVLAC